MEPKKKRISLHYQVAEGNITDEQARKIAHAGGYTPEASAWHAQKMIDGIKKDAERGTKFLLGFLGKEPVAVISYSENPQIGLIVTIQTHVVKGMRRQGIATKMIYRLIGMARKKGFMVKRPGQSMEMLGLAEKMRKYPRKHFGRNRKTPFPKLPEKIFRTRDDINIAPIKRRHKTALKQVMQNLRRHLRR